MTLQDDMLQRIRAVMPDADITLNDMGGGDHWEAVIISSHFEGKTPIARHRAVYGALGELMHGPVHLLTMRTLTPSQAKD